ncbi:uncharacterized protein Grl40a [Eurosta solidaginis]|uniref:uncharacterized protein Grl40a n=1 Tax=Eurosta solidaginis TaxID=178769 RepID=UPI0035313E85
MDYNRILRITNCFLVITGFQLHTFESSTGRFLFSLWALMNFIVLTLFYTICVNQHFTQSPLLKIFNDLSPFFWKLIRLHLLLGVTVYIFRIFQMPGIGRSCNSISSWTTRTRPRKCAIAKAFAYFLFFSTFFISLCFAVYIAYEMKFKMPPWDNIFISLGLFIPHFTLAGALKLYTLNCWLMQDELSQVKLELADVLSYQFPIEIYNEVSTRNDVVKITEINVQKLLEQHYNRLLQLASELQLLNVTLEKDLLLLLVMNSICLLAAVHTLVYFQTSWYLFLSPSWKRIFYAENVAVYVLISWDYLCLCISVGFFNKLKWQILERIERALRSKKYLASTCYANLKDVRYLLTFALRLRLFNIVDINSANLIMMHVILGIIISIFVIYHYLNDQIVSIAEQVDSITIDD